LTKVDDLPTQSKLRQRYCEGNIEHWGKQEQQAARRIYAILHTLSNKQLTGNADALQPGTFWSAE